ncbi:SRPBCC family protein [Longispora sp. K20-0274]|uniref:SRPBCC family protein n=1 Tax=Longispora sp. K20-0274 TaxID=3088255 RepID=UPI00399B8176
MYQMVQRIDVRVSTPATPATVHALLRDGATWPAWSPLTSFTLERPGPDAPEGVDAIRVFRTGRSTSRERVSAVVPDRRFGYELLSGLPLTDYRAFVDLTPTPGGTEIHWHSTFRAKVPGTGWAYRLALGLFIRRCARGLAEYAAGTTTAASGRG